MTQVLLYCFYIVSRLDGEHSIAMAEVVKSQFWQAHFDKEPFQVPVNQIVVQMLSKLIGKYQTITSYLHPNIEGWRYIVR